MRLSKFYRGSPLTCMRHVKTDVGLQKPFPQSQSLLWTLNLAWYSVNMQSISLYLPFLIQQNAMSRQSCVGCRGR